MRRVVAGALLAGAVMTPGVAAADSRVAPAAVAGQERPGVQRAIQAFVDAGFAGVQARVRDERGEWVGTAGVRKLGASAKPPANGSFWAGSVTKSFVATVVLQLVAEGEIGLDEPVAGHLPEFGLDERITVRMLLQHTSGLYNYTGELGPDGVFVPGVAASGKEWVDNRFRSYEPAELVRFALAKPARFEPGAGWSYSNTNYTLAQLLVEQLTGRPLGEELQRRILKPLGLRNTMLPGDRTTLPGPHAHGYYRYQDGEEWKVVDVSRQNLSVVEGAGDILSTTADLQTYFSALNKGRLLPAALLAEMRVPHPDSAGLFGRYGLGTYVLDTGSDCAGVIVNHNGSPPGGYGALMYSSLDGSRTLTASLTSGDADVNVGAVFPGLLDGLVKEVFCGS
uniref:D-alanyl-D-alanine carboxypeptidase n=1 Tax=Nonomuraea gerenzanensis TaxID=93944 RepID=A0A1M4DY02_9ACTN|nr:D-alanyl-D-alanine carboxypeptidase [Nonomuraea gerenzanensis]